VLAAAGGLQGLPKTLAKRDVIGIDHEGRQASKAVPDAIPADNHDPMPAVVIPICGGSPLTGGGEYTNRSPNWRHEGPLPEYLGMPAAGEQAVGLGHPRNKVKDFVRLAGRGAFPSRDQNGRLATWLAVLDGPIGSVPVGLDAAEPAAESLDHGRSREEGFAPCPRFWGCRPLNCRVVFQK